MLQLGQRSENKIKGKIYCSFSIKAHFSSVGKYNVMFNFYYIYAYLNRLKKCAAWFPE